MKPRPIRMPDSLWDDLKDEAGDRGLSTAEYIRNLLRAREQIEADTQADTDAVQLRERVQALEDAVYDGSESAPAQHPDTQPDTQDGRGSVPDSLNRWLVEDGPQTEHGRRGVRRCVEELVERGALTSEQLTDMLQGEIGDHYSRRKSMWESVKRWLKEAPGVRETDNYQEWAFDSEKTRRGF